MQRVKKNTRLFDLFNTVFLLAVTFVSVAPFLYILAASLSSTDAILKNEVSLLPVGFTLGGYAEIFMDLDFFKAYGNTLIYTGAGTLLSVMLTMAAAYPLSRRTYSLRTPIMVMITLTIFFSGGLVPSYILINRLGLYDTRWAIIIPGAVNAFHLIVARVYMQMHVHDSMIESAKLDGANDMQIFRQLVLPMSKVIIAVLVLFYAVVQWNSYYPAMIYLRDPDLVPLSLYLRRVLIMSASNPGPAVIRLRNCAVIVTMAPIICIYPFMQKHFSKGVMLGSLKE